MNLQLSRKNQYFLRKLTTLSLPIMLQNLITSSLNFVDTFMLGQLGEASIAAVGFANQIFFLYNTVVFGLTSGVSVFFAQYWGKRDMDNISRVMGIDVLFGGALGILILIVVQTIPVPIIRLFTEDGEARRLAAEYLRIVSVTYVMYALSFGFSMCLKCVGKPIVPMRISAVCVGINALANYLLIFGKFGFPELGVAGAAIGTLIARAVELLLTGGHIFFGAIRLRVREMFRLSGAFVARIMKTATPVLLNESVWGFAVIVGTWCYSKLGMASFAAYQIANTVLNIFTMFVFGIATAGGIMIGNAIGMGLVRTAQGYARRFLWISSGLGAALGALLFWLAPYILTMFRVQPETVEIALSGLRAMAAIVMFKSYASTLIVGIFRGGGDTRYAFVLEACTMCFISVPMAYIGAVWLHLPLWVVIFMVGVEEIAKAAVGTPRVLSGKWVRRLV